MSKEYVIEDWLTTEYDYERPHRGEIREGILLDFDDKYGAIIDIGLKHDGIVPREDFERLEEETVEDLELGQEIKTQVVRPQDQEGNLVLSLAYMQEEQDWNKAQEYMEQDEVWEGQVTGYNRGGVLVKFGVLTGFVPASHLSGWDRNISSKQQRKAKLKEYMGKELPFKIIEANQEERNLILSERLASQQIRQQNREARISEFLEGEIHQGVVCDIVDFGAFIDLGGIDGLVHISELSWRRIRHPNEVVNAGDELDVYILGVDHERKQISLSLKRLHPNPWDRIAKTYSVDQLVQGTVTNVVDFGAFVALEDSDIEGLLHVSEIADPEPDNPREFLERGDKLLLRILHIDPDRQRLGLSLKQVPEEAIPNSKNMEQQEEQEQAAPEEDTPQSA